MRVAGGRSTQDPFALARDSTLGPYLRSYPGKTTVQPLPVPGQSNLVIVSAGQSHLGNNGTASVATAVAGVENLNFLDGGVYGGGDPLLGVTGVGGTWLTRLGNLLVNNGDYDRVMNVPTAIGGASVGHYVPGGEIGENLRVAVLRSRALGFEPGCFIWQQGQKDGLLGTSQGTYQSQLTSIINYVRAIGANAPWFIALSSYNQPGSVTYPAIRAAQAAVVNGTDIFQGADDDTLLGGTYRSGDGLHFTGAGMDALAALWRPILLANL